MFNRSEILRKAWAGYRVQVGQSEVFKFSRKLFSSYLRAEWRSAKATALYIAQCEAEAGIPPHIRALRSELLGMEMGERMDWARHRELSVELFRASVELGPAAA